MKLLAQTNPAGIVLLDLLALGDRDLQTSPLVERRALLERALAGGAPSVHVTPATRDRDVAQDWFSRFEGAGLDGVVAKRLDARYQPGVRAMMKVKHERTADCAVVFEGMTMPYKDVVEQAKKDLEEGKSPSTAAGEFVRREVEHVREGKHGARSPQQAVAIGLSEARRAVFP